MTVYQILVVILITLITFIVGYFLGRKFEKRKPIGDLHIIKDRSTDIYEMYLAFYDNSFLVKSQDDYAVVKVVRSTSQESQVV